MGIHIQTKICIQIFREVLFIIAKKWKQSKCPPPDKWVKPYVIYPFNGIWFSHKKEWSTDACHNMGDPWKRDAKWKKPDTNPPDRQNVGFHLYAMSRRGKPTETESRLIGAWKNKLVSITKKKQTHRYREQTSGYQWGEGMGGSKIGGRD